jgi:hypothetical protein
MIETDPRNPRPNAKDVARARALKLRRDGWSVDEIAAEVGVARSTAWTWVRDLAIDPGTEHAAAKRARANRITDARWARHRANRDAARGSVIAATVAEIGDLSAREVLLIGAAIYWCEGRKAKPWAPDERITFTNSDPTLIGMFLRFLDVCGVEAARVRYRVTIHETSDSSAAAEWWAGRLDLPRDRFHPPTIKRHRPMTRRRNVNDHYHGCLVVTVSRGRDVYWRILGLVTAAGRPFAPITHSVMDG